MSLQLDPFDQLAKHLRCSREQAREKFWEWFYGARLGPYQPGVPHYYRATADAIVAAAQTSRKRKR